MSQISIDRLHQLFLVEDGKLIRRIGVKGFGGRQGMVAGSLNRRGYVALQADGFRLRAHRVIWAMCKGEWPKHYIDHIDGNPSNNRIENLRDVTQSVNLQNQRRAPSSSKSGLIGASPKGRKWAASIKVGGKQIALGQFPTPELAHRAYVAAKRELHEGNIL